MHMPAIHRSPRRILSVLLFVHAVCATAAIAVPKLEWLDVRRRGADAIAELGRERSAPRPWQRTFKATVPATHPMAGLKITLARGYAGHTQFLVRVVAGPAQLVGTGVVIDGAKSWMRVVGEKAKPLPQESIFRAQPVLELPWIAFCALEWGAQYTATVEGEFDQVAVLRLTPRYELGVTARAAKVSISKITGAVVAEAINDGKGKKLGEVDYQSFDADGLPGEFLLKGPGDNPASVRFVADGPVTTPAKTAFSAASLK
jgi:hypothetical protein